MHLSQSPDWDKCIELQTDTFWKHCLDPTLPIYRGEEEEEEGKEEEEEEEEDCLLYSITAV